MAYETLDSIFPASNFTPDLFAAQDVILAQLAKIEEGAIRASGHQTPHYMRPRSGVAAELYAGRPASLPVEEMARYHDRTTSALTAVEVMMRTLQQRIEECKARLLDAPAEVLLAGSGE